MAEADERFDACLRNIMSIIEAMPTLAAIWAEEPQLNRDLWYWHWQSQLLSLTTWDQAYQSGTMTTEQQRRYSELLQRLSEAIPAIAGLGWPLPPALAHPQSWDQRAADQEQPAAGSRRGVSSRPPPSHELPVAEWLGPSGDTGRHPDQASSSGSPTGTS